MCSLSSTLRYCCVGPAPFDDIGDYPYQDGRDCLADETAIQRRVDTRSVARCSSSSLKSRPLSPHTTTVIPGHCQIPAGRVGKHHEGKARGLSSTGQLLNCNKDIDLDSNEIRYRATSPRYCDLESLGKQFSGGSCNSQRKLSNPRDKPNFPCRRTPTAISTFPTTCSGQRGHATHMNRSNHHTSLKFDQHQVAIAHDACVHTRRTSSPRGVHGCGSSISHLHVCDTWRCDQTDHSHCGNLNTRHRVLCKMDFCIQPNSHHCSPEFSALEIQSKHWSVGPPKQACHEKELNM